MRRYLLGIALVAAAMSSSPAQSADPVTINFWHYQTSNREVLSQAVRDFEAANPDVKVQELFKDLSNLASDIQAARLVDRAPDVAQVLGRLTIGMIKSSDPVALDSGPDHGAFLANIAPNFRAVGVYQRRSYLVPQSFGTPLLYINRDIFRAAGLDPDKPPRTWQELRDQAIQIKQKTGKYALYVATSGRDVAPQQMLVNAGANMLSEDFTRATFATPDAIAAMQFWQDMAIVDKSLAIFAERENDSLFRAGQIAMMVTSVASYQGADRAAKGVFDLGIAHYPTWGDKPRRVPNSGSGFMIFSDKPARREAAFRFLAYMMQPAVSNRWAVESGYLPIAPGAKDAEVVRAYIAKDPRWGVAVDQMADLVPTARWPGSRAVEMQIALENMLAALWQGKGRAATLVPAAEKEITRLIAAGAD